MIRGRGEENWRKDKKEGKIGETVKRVRRVGENEWLKLMIGLRNTGM